jgi:hypothetical protein
MLYIDRKFQLLIIVMVSLFIVLRATTGGPSIAKTFKNRVCRHTAFEIQVKESEGGANKIGEIAEFCSPSFSFVPTASYIARFHHKSRIDSTHVSTLIPARSPPFFS